MTRVATIAASAALAIALGAAGAQAKPDKPDNPKPNNVAAKICQAEKHADPAAFEATYAVDGKHAMRNCKRAHREEATAIVANAAQECHAEQDADPVLFEQTYGTNGNKKNAFGKCVSQKVHEALASA